MKKQLAAAAFMLIGFSAFSQDIDIKKGMVTIDGKECLKVDKSDPNNVAILDLQGNEIIYLKYIRPEYDPMYCKVIFLPTKQSLSSRTYMYTPKLLIKKLLNDNTLKDCKIDPAKIENFVLKHGENIERDVAAPN